MKQQVSGSQVLVISDVDGTLLGDDNALAELAEWHDAHANQVTLVYSSGRFYHSVLESIRTTRLPTPTAIIGGVGTDVHRFGESAPLPDWHRTFTGWNVQTVRTILSEYSELEPQPDEFQSNHKLSYYALELDSGFLTQLSQQLHDAGWDVSLVYSSQRDLDVLPKTANKGTAAAFIAQHLGYEPGQVIVCGDSGNDLAMFQQAHFRGVVVGNAHPELKNLRSDRIYQAGRGYAGGVLEGLRHWLDEAGS